MKPRWASKQKHPDMIPRLDSDSELESESDSERKDTFLPWTTNDILTQIDVTEAVEAPNQESDSESDSDTNLPDLTERDYFIFEDSDSEEDGEIPDQESYTISESRQDSTEINGTVILLTIPEVQSHPKKTILCLLNSGSSLSLLNYDVLNQNVKSKERYKEVWDNQGGTFAPFPKLLSPTFNFRSSPLDETSKPKCTYSKRRRMRSMMQSSDET